MIDEFVVAQFGGEKEPQRALTARVLPRGRSVLERVLARSHWARHRRTTHIAHRLADADWLVVGHQVRLKPSRGVEGRVGAAEKTAMHIAVLQDMRSHMCSHLRNKKQHHRFSEPRATHVVTVESFCLQ